MISIPRSTHHASSMPAISDLNGFMLLRSAHDLEDPSQVGEPRRRAIAPQSQKMLVVLPAHPLELDEVVFFGRIPEYARSSGPGAEAQRCGWASSQAATARRRAG